MKINALIPALMLFAFAGCVEEPQAPVWYNVWKLDETYEYAIDDVMQWTADNFADGPRASLTYWQLQSFELDLSHDGQPELFVTTPRLHGNGGGPHLVFQQQAENYVYIGQLGGRRSTMRVLPTGTDGLPRIMTLWNHGGGSCTVDVWKNDGKRFVKVSSETIHPGDSGTEEGRRRFAELFGTP